MKQRITDPDSLLRLGAGKAYLSLVRKDLSVSESTIAELEATVTRTYKLLGKNPEIFVDNPRDFFEKKAFKRWQDLDLNLQ